MSEIGRQVKLTLAEEMMQELQVRARAEGLTLAAYTRVLVYQQLRAIKKKEARGESAGKAGRAAAWKKMADLL